ncbi:Acetoin catabolism regulatory protein [Marinobacterium sp. xm-a-121]|nr:Acetoin catabolism regulatory protein [Marinobacterium sp. xm-a-121]NRP57583.1 Acetoin catabolism regulatory protein [Marinobacterium sp. xm-d-510]NRP98095.1 Acetoin catabolism regulatory protein [Marinobacterium sp. xm-a-127]NRP98839.1 Acetoin catabolism regulatory protein [Marinobacterium sp. xm-v-233]
MGSLIQTNRELFQNGAFDKIHGVHQPILDSWMRCANGALSMNASLDYEILKGFEFESIRDKNLNLLRIANVHIDRLAQAVSPAGWSLMLTDTKCRSLRAIKSKSNTNLAINSAFQEGIVLSENKVGSTAMSCAIHSQSLVRVFGGEHFNEAHEQFNCAAVPILDEKGHVCAALDITHESPIVDSSILYLLKSTAQTIQNQIIKQIPESLVIELSINPTNWGDPSNLVLSFDHSQSLVGANEIAKKFIYQKLNLKNASFEDIFKTSFSEVLDFGLMRGRVFEMVLKNDIVLYGVVQTENRNSSTIRGLNLISEFNSDQTEICKPPQSRLVNQMREEDLKLSLHNAGKVISRLPILLTGASGTGKDVAAREIHSQSHFKDGNFVAINCAAIPENMLEVELFGYVPGAYTGALSSGSSGLIGEANGGTLFLDEIGDMPLLIQSKLLRLLESGEYRPVGGVKPLLGNFQLISATNIDLEQSVKESKFRADLFYRIKGLSIELPNLAKRNDILHLTESILSDISASNRKISDGLADFFTKHEWPGNIRELKNLLIQLDAIVPPDCVLSLNDLPLSYLNLLEKSKHNNSEDKLHLEDNTKNLISAAIEKADGNLSYAAKILGISRSTLYRKIKSYGY